MFSGNSEKLFLFHAGCIFKLDIDGWNFHHVDWIKKKTGSEVEINVETLFVVVYSNAGVMKSVSEKCDWKVSSSFIIKDLRFHIYELGLCGRC